MSTQEQVEEKVVNGANETVAPKKRRRGINNETRSASRKKFQHTDAVKGVGLFLGNVDIRKEWVTFGEKEGGRSQFMGCKVPKFVVEFSSLGNNVSEKKYAYINILPVESNVDTIPGGSKEWAFTQPIATIKHILEVFVLRGRTFTDEELDMLELGYEDYDEDGSFVPVEPEEILKSWSILFDNVLKLIETGNNGKSALLDASGKPVEVWSKLLRYIKYKGEWQPIQDGDLVFPHFVGEGIFELVRRDKDTKLKKQPSMILDITKECITPMNIEKKKPNIGVGAGVGIPVGAGIIPPAAPNIGVENAGGFAGAFATDENGSDLPF